MNKLSLFVLSIFLLLGAALWGLANISFQAYLQSQFANIGSKVLGYEVTVGNAVVQQASGELQQLTVTAEQTVILTVGAITYQLNEKSLKEEIIELEKVSFVDLEKTLTGGLANKNMLANIERSLKQMALAKTDNEKFPLFMVKSAVIKNSTGEQDIVLNSTIMNKGLPADQAFITLFHLALLQLP
ncbi:MAG: hypothetical protein ACSHW0_17550 [Thalassotalea sp.]